MAGLSAKEDVKMDSHQDLLKRIATLEHKLDVLVEYRVGVLEDIEAIKRLQRMYGYYTDLCLWEQMAGLFADTGAAIEIGRRGRYEGKENILTFLRDVNGGGESGLKFHQVINHVQHQGIVTVDSDRQRAHGRWRAVVQAGGGEQRQAISGQDQAMMYAEGVYENTYVKEGGTWKIALLFWVPTYYVTHPYSRMWFESGAVSASIPPQRPPTAPVAGLGRQFMPFHYRHPVTGEVVSDVVAGKKAGG
jgi:SnoaL-like domain